VSLVPYFPLSPEVVRRIVGLQMDRIRRRVWDSYRAALSWAPELEDVIAQRCTETASGARNVENILSRTLLPELSAHVLSRLADGGVVGEVKIGVGASGLFDYELA